jgi:hypothetical protein
VKLVDEEGLPIIDITEPLQGADPTPTSDRPLMADPELVPLVSLSETEVERRRRERDRILDLLEEEERREQALIEEQEQEEKREAIIRRKNVSKFELEKLKAAKEMQKKMGKALLRNMAEAREREEKEKRVVLALDEEAEAKKKTLKAKKSVSFADLPPLTDDERNRENTKISAKGARFDWGDVTPAKLRATNRHTLLTKAQIEKHPMKMDVIERIPLGATLAEGSLVKQRDSDDESVPDTRISDNGETIQLGHDYGDDSEPVEVPPSLDSGGDEEPGNEPVEDECDLDMARHQREIALEYYEKRRTIGEEVLEAMGSNMPKEAADEWDQEVGISHCRC